MDQSTKVHLNWNSMVEQLRLRLRSCIEGKQEGKPKEARRDSQSWMFFCFLYVKTIQEEHPVGAASMPLV